MATGIENASACVEMREDEAPRITDTTTKFTDTTTEFTASASREDNCSADHSNDGSTDIDYATTILKQTVNTIKRTRVCGPSITGTISPAKALMAPDTFSASVTDTTTLIPSGRFTNPTPHNPPINTKKRKAIDILPSPPRVAPSPPLGAIAAMLLNPRARGVHRARLE